ncbi:MAG: ParA family protein [Bauldia sp.]|uniref:ParA family partition ATPase n=1 Tax=Bauldia sp. TaxID=2575872 RepID=UPI001D8C692B|nr:ParA family partition ATPase [Bauldia sp.]MCB1497905.1 ParA family protein [Bauldia sp.]
MPGVIITIAQQKGGSGKTTVAAHLAVALGTRDKSVAIVDVDPQGSLGEWFERREERLGEEGIDLEFRTASGWGARREARNLARHHDFVVVDTPPKSDIEMRPAIEIADLVVVPLQPTPVDLWATEPTLQMVAKEGNEALLVLNRVVRRALLTAEMADATGGLGYRVARAQLGNRVAFPSSMGSGSTVIETDPNGIAAEEVRALAKEVARRAKE